MRLEPVYLVAPAPKPPSMPTRRAFFLAGGMFVAGAALGGACGYSLASTAPAPESGKEEELEPSGDVELDELRRLAVKAPIEELMQRAPIFLAMRDRAYPTDSVLWRGVERMALRLIRHPDQVPQPGVIPAVIATIDRGGPPIELGLERLLPDLRAARTKKGK